MESIRVKSKNTYAIEVNDQGECIEFDLTDIELPFRLEAAKKAVHDAGSWLKGQLAVIAKKQDTAKKGDLLSAKERANLEAYRECFVRMRKAIDLFAGEGASRKIFGDHNYLEMFNDFMEQMEPHFEKMMQRGMDIRKNIEAKYGDTAEEGSVL